MPSVHFFYEDVDFKLKKTSLINRWIKEVITLEDRTLGSINYIFCSDDYLLEINKEYLNHNTFTDVITFDNSEEAKKLSGDIFISIERVKDNATLFESPFEDELNRVMIHGVLHLIGYKDKSTDEKKLMRKREEAYLSLR